MTRLTRLTLTTFLSAGLAASAVAQETHPETGDTLAADQTFTYRILDNISSIDPQIVEDAAHRRGVAREEEVDALWGEDDRAPNPGGDRTRPKALAPLLETVQRGEEVGADVQHG